MSFSPEEPSRRAEVGLLSLSVRERCFPRLWGGVDEPVPIEVSVIGFGSSFCCPLPSAAASLPQHPVL